MEAINLKITNNANVELPISILGTIQNPNSFLNYSKSYDFDLTGEVLNNVIFLIVYSSVSSPSTTLTYSFINPIPTIQGYVDALNSAGIGFFTYSGNIIYMFSNNYIGISIKI